jgi:zinc transporter ZupT
MLLDFLPGSLGLGGLAASGADTITLLAALIALQNLPEGFNAYHKLCDASHRSRTLLLLMLALLSLGTIFGLGSIWLPDKSNYWAPSCYWPVAAFYISSFRILPHRSFCASIAGRR